MGFALFLATWSFLKSVTLSKPNKTIQSSTDTISSLAASFFSVLCCPPTKKQHKNRYFWPLPAKNTINNYSAAVSSAYQRVPPPLGPQKGCWRLSDTLLDICNIVPCYLWVKNYKISVTFALKHRTSCEIDVFPSHKRLPTPT